jgi:adenosylcobinamide-GDP ribazoletransferase
MIIFSGLRLALTTLTVAPLNPGRTDRRAAAAAMALAPGVGLALGAALAGVAWGLDRIGFAALPIGAMLTLLMALLTRGLHLDGLADTADALASYRDRDQALAIMKSPEVGPMGVAAIAGVLVLDTAALTVLASRHEWLAIAIGVAAGRLAITMCCWRRIPPARSDGLGALVAATVPAGVWIGWGLLLVGAVSVLGPHHWQGIAAVPLALAVILVLLRHVFRRLGGVTGDILGAACEISAALTLLLLGAQ